MQLDDFLAEALRVDGELQLSPAVVAHAAAVAGQPAETTRQVAALLRQAAQVSLPVAHS